MRPAQRYSFTKAPNQWAHSLFTELLRRLTRARPGAQKHKGEVQVSGRNPTTTHCHDSLSKNCSGHSHWHHCCHVVNGWLCGSAIANTNCAQVPGIGPFPGAAAANNSLLWCAMGCMNHKGHRPTCRLRRWNSRTSSNSDRWLTALARDNRWLPS